MHSTRRALQGRAAGRPQPAHNKLCQIPQKPELELCVLRALRTVLDAVQELQRLLPVTRAIPGIIPLAYTPTHNDVIC